MQHFWREKLKWSQLGSKIYQDVLKTMKIKQIDHVVSQVDKTTIIIYDEQEEDEKPSRQKIV